MSAEVSNFQPTRANPPTSTADRSVVEQAHTTMTRAKAQFERHLRGIERSRYSAEGLRSEISSFASTDDARAVDQAVDQVRQRRDQAQAEVDQIRRGLSPDGDVAAELRASRYWDRSRRILDNLDSGKLLGAAQELLSTADRSELATLLTELGPYFTSRGQTTKWIEPTVARIVPEFGCARERLAEADKALQVVTYNAAALGRGFTEGRPPAVLADPGKYDPDR